MPEAEDYIRNRLNSIPQQAEPVIIMAAKLGEALDSRGAKIRNWYEGENFNVCYFDPGEQPETEQIELLGQHVSITSEALKHLAGHALALRRVKPAYGLIANQRYVLVADSAPGTAGVSVEDGGQVKSDLSIAALTVLGGFTGMGIVWIASAIIANTFKVPDDKFLPLTPPLFVAGWIVGAFVSFFFFRGVYKTKGRTRFAQEQMEQKYLGYGGLGAEMNWWIFVGIPTPLIIALILLLEEFARTIEQKTAAAFIAIVVVGVPVMYFCDRIPRHIVIGLGLLGWGITFVGGFWYFKTHGP